MLRSEHSGWFAVRTGKGFSPLSCQAVRPASDTVLVYSSFRSQQVVAASRLEAQFLQPVSRGVLLRIRGETTWSQALMRSTLFSRQRSKLIPASPADLLAEDWFSFIGFPFCSVFRIYKVVAPFGSLLPLQPLVGFYTVFGSDRIGHDFGMHEQTDLVEFSTKHSVIRNVWKG